MDTCTFCVFHMQENVRWRPEPDDFCRQSARIFRAVRPNQRLHDNARPNHEAFAVGSGSCSFSLSNSVQSCILTRLFLHLHSPTRRSSALLHTTVLYVLSWRAPPPYVLFRLVPRPAIRPIVCVHNALY